MSKSAFSCSLTKIKHLNLNPNPSPKPSLNPNSHPITIPMLAEKGPSSNVET